MLEKNFNYHPIVIYIPAGVHLSIGFDGYLTSIRGNDEYGTEIELVPRPGLLIGLVDYDNELHLEKDVGYLKNNNIDEILLAHIYFERDRITASVLQLDYDKDFDIKFGSAGWMDPTELDEWVTEVLASAKDKQHSERYR